MPSQPNCPVPSAVTADHGLCHLSVPWDLVTVARDYLAARGCRSTLCMNPSACEAHLVLWPGADPHRAAELLVQLRTKRRPSFRLAA